MALTENDHQRRAWFCVNRGQYLLNAIPERIPTGEQDVRYALFLGDLPHTLLVIKIRSVLGKPENPNMFANIGLFPKRFDFLGRMNRAVIDRQDNLFFRLARMLQQPMGKDQKLERAFPAFGYPWNVMEMLPAGIIDGAEGHDFLVLTWRGDLGLFPPAHPHPSQMGMEVKIRLIFVPQFVACRELQSPFFRAARRRSAA